jgi:hypothetical protein
VRSAARKAGVGGAMGPPAAPETGKARFPFSGVLQTQQQP